MLYKRVMEFGHPTELYVFIHEAASGIDDSLFTMSMGDTNTFANCNSAAALHNKATSLGWADGHAESHRWDNVQKNATTAQDEINRMGGAITQDAVWLKAKTTEPQ